MSTNVLVATSNVKLYTGITTTSYDALIEALNPIVLDDIRHYCKNDFANSTMYFWDDQVSFSTSTGSNSILSSDTDIDYTDFIAAGNVISVVDSIQNNAYYSVSSVATTYIIVNESITTESSSTGKYPVIKRIEYPKDLPFIASRMIKHLIDTQNNAGYQSESLGDYSYTLTTIIGSNSYPQSIAGALTKYRKVRML
jgi:hypothetical protein